MTAPTLKARTHPGLSYTTLLDSTKWQDDDGPSATSAPVRVLTSRRSRLGLTDPVRVLVLTYNRTLEGYIAELARQQVTGHTGLHLEVSTFGKWARDLLGAPQVMGYEDTTSAIRRLLKPIVTDLRYFGNEVEYLLGRFEPANLDAYLDIKRSPVSRHLRGRQHVRDTHTTRSTTASGPCKAW